MTPGGAGAFPSAFGHLQVPERVMLLPMEPLRDPRGSGRPRQHLASTRHEPQRSAPAPAARSRSVQAREGRSGSQLARGAGARNGGRGGAGCPAIPGGLLSGYFLEGGVADTALPATEVARRLGPPPPEAPDVALGFFERWRRRIYASVVYLTPDGEQWRPVHVHRKMFLPTYGVFDEARFVEPGTDVRAFDTRFGRIGMLVCEEMWHSLPATVLGALGRRADPGGERISGAGLLTARGRPSRKPGTLGHAGPGGGGRTRAFRRRGPASRLRRRKTLPRRLDRRGPRWRRDRARPSLRRGGRERDPERARSRASPPQAPLLADLEQALPHLQRALEEVGERAHARRRGPRSAGGRRRATVAGSDATEPTLASAEPVPLQGFGLRVGDAGPLPDPYDPSALDVNLALVERTLIEFIRESCAAAGASSGPWSASRAAWTPQSRSCSRRARSVPRT